MSDKKEKKKLLVFTLITYHLSLITHHLSLINSSAPPPGSET
jgi:hypothetical protein